MFNSNSMSPADLAAVTNGNNNGIWGDNGMLWLIIILLFFGMGNGNWGNNNSGAAENYVLSSDFATLQRQIDSTSNTTQNMVSTNADQLQRQIVSIGNGISSLGYDQLTRMNGINSAISSATYDLSTQLNNIASNQQSCCCTTNNNLTNGFADVNYRMATNTCAITTNATDNTRAIIDNSNANYRALDAKINDMQTQALQDKINTLTADNQALKFAASQQAQNAYLISALNPTPVPSYPASTIYGSNCPCSSCS